MLIPMLNDTEYVIRARQIIAGWEGVGMPSGPVADNLRIIAETVARLREIIAMTPTREHTLLQLVGRYEAMGAALKRAQK